MHAPREPKQPASTPARHAAARRPDQQRRAGHPTARTVQDVGLLQRTVGNAATVQLLASDEESEPVRSSTPPARGDLLNLRDHEGRELYSDDVELQLEYVRYLATAGRPDRYRLLLARLRAKKQQDQAHLLEEEWSRTAGPNPAGHVPVPKQMHFIWLGKKPGEAVIENLKAWGRRAEGSGWTLNLWTESSGWVPELESEFQGQLQMRTGARETVERNTVPENLALYDRAKENGAANLSSDILRYALLLEYGGAYVDVDIGPGGVNLAAAPEMRQRLEELPLLAPTLRDRNSVNKALRLGEQESQRELTPEDQRKAATKKYADGLLNNNFIQAAPNSQFIRSVLDGLPRRLEEVRTLVGEEGFDEKLKDLAAHISGPDFVERTLRLFVREHHGVSTKEHIPGRADTALLQKEYLHLFDAEALEYWKDLEWVTAESENQLDSASGRGAPEVAKLGEFRRLMNKSLRAMKKLRTRR